MREREERDDDITFETTQKGSDVERGRMRGRRRAHERDEEREREAERYIERKGVVRKPEGDIEMQHEKERAVSYTHLTLPTICSV